MAKVQQRLAYEQHQAPTFFSTTSAARSSKLSENEVAMPETVFIEHGATTIAAGRNGPDEIAAAMSLDR